MFGLGSHLNTSHEVYNLYEKNKDKGSWERVVSEDLGRVITSYALGDFDGDGIQKEVVGTENGWVLVLDRSPQECGQFGHVQRVREVAFSAVA